MYHRFVTGAVHDWGTSAAREAEGSKPGAATSSRWADERSRSDGLAAGNEATGLDAVRVALGNRGFQNYVRTLARQPRTEKPSPGPVTVYIVGSPPPIHATARATDRNQRLAELIDELDKLSAEEVIERRRTEVYAAQAKTVSDRSDHELALEAAEYVASYRHLDALAGYYTVDNPGTRRLNIRVGLEDSVREQHSFKKAFEKINDVPGNDDAKAFFSEWETLFRDRFKRQAYGTMFAMLDGSMSQIEEVLRSYGIPVPAAKAAGGRLAHSQDSGLRGEATSVLGSMKASDDANTRAHYDARESLAKTVGALKRQRQLAEQLDHEAGVIALDVPPNVQGPKADAMMKKKSDAVVEKTKFRQMWIEAEQKHPVLIAYRAGGDIFKVDLGNLDTAPVDDEMTAVLLKVLPKIGDIIAARDQLHSGDLVPWSIPSVVALTKANMFIPTDSLRDGVANDLADEAKSDSRWVMLGAFLLAAVTFFPTGGASLGIAAGAASLGLAAYTAVHEWEVYKRQKMLSDTDLDIAHSLATEEPSLTPFIVSLVSLGLEPLVLLSALNKARKLKALSDIGDDTSAVVKELNQIGEKAGKRGLGEEALDDIEGVEEEGTQTGKGSKAAKGSKVAPGIPKIKDTALGFLNKADAREAAIRRFAAIRGQLPERWDMVRAALKEKDVPINQEIAGLLDKYMTALRDTDAWGDVMADAWEIAARMRRPNLRTALVKLAKKRGMKLITVPKVETGAKFFDEVVVSGRGIIDPALATEDILDPALVKEAQVFHGELTHLIQDLVVDQKLGAGASARFRKLLGQAEGTVERYVPGRSGVKTKFGAFDGEVDPRYNVTFLPGENSMKTGDYVWRFTYDLFYTNAARRRMPQPEAMGKAIKELFGVR